MSPEHWPLPWYLREYTHVGYWGHMVQTSEPIVIALKPQVPEVEQAAWRAEYRLFSTHELASRQYAGDVCTQGYPP